MAFNGNFVLNLAYSAAAQGGNMEKLIALSGKTFDELNKEACIVENAGYNAVIESAVKMTGDQFFGLHAGENLNLSAVGLIGQITQTSQTVKQALEFCCEFANLGCSALPMQLVETKNHYKVTMTPDEVWKQQSQVSFEHTTDGVLAFTIKEFQALTRMMHKPIEVHVTWTKSKDISEYERVYGCPIYFGKKEIAILLKKEHIEDEILTSDYNLLRILVAHAEEKSAKINKEQGFAARVKQVVVKLANPEFPTIAQAAKHLNLSLRTLQRRLKENNYTYKMIIDELRLAFAISYLKRPELSLGEIAYLLSYADGSAFSRSFKRWTGKTAREYRANMS